MSFQPSSMRVRLSLVILAFGAISVAMVVRSTWLQIIHDPKLEALAKKQFQSKILMKPRRGLILDRTGEPLAINLETSSLAGNPQRILKSTASLRLLAHGMNLHPRDMAKKLDPKKSFMWIERHMSDERMERLKKFGVLQPSGDMPDGLWLVKEMKRVYPHGELASSLIGSVNVDVEGLEGVELWKNSTLRGKGTSFNAYKDALGRPALLTSNAQTKMEDGGNIELSIDASLQFSVEASLNDSLERTRADSGMVIVMDASNGEILALAQSPARRVKKVTAVTDAFEPGSVMKPLILAQAYNHGVIRPRDSLFGHFGKFTVQKRTINEAEAHEKFGYIHPSRMIEVSSNIAAAELALKIGSERLVSYLREMGLGSQTGVGFPGELSGRFPTSPKGKPLPPLTLATMGFGQSMMATPLQIIRAYAAIANGGYLIEPTLTKNKEDAPIKKITLFKSSVVKDVTDALILVTEGEKGTGKQAQLEGYQIAGKTGTAQTVDRRTRRYSSTNYNASFVGFPVGVKQPIVVLTLLNHPRGIYYAGETAAPLFSKVLKQVVGRFSIPTTQKIKPHLAEASREEVKLEKASAEAVAHSIESTKEVNLDHPVMPSVLGLTPQEAIRALKPFMPQVHIHGFGLIRKQSPESGTMISPQVRVSLYLEE